MLVICVVSTVESSDYTSSIGTVSSMDRASRGCYTCSVSSIEQATIPVVLGTCSAWSMPAVAIIPAASPV